MRNTEASLMARGLDSEFARKLSAEGWTLAKLKQADRPVLRQAGLDENFIDQVLGERKPPIPTQTLMSLLFANRFQCCVCRYPALPIIVHHIEEWESSRSHEIGNLAVLCPTHHDKVHCKSRISQNLDPRTLRAFKENWELEVKRFDSESILKAMRLVYSSWNYINEQRVFELAKITNIDFKKLSYFRGAFSQGVAEADGMPSPVHSNDLLYKYQGAHILLRYACVSDMLSSVISELAIVNISDYLDKGILKFALTPGDFNIHSRFSRFLTS